MARPKGSKNKKNETSIVLTPKIVSEVNLEADKEIPKDNSYTASIKVLGKFYEAKGKTITDAISNIKLDGVARGVTVLTIKKGDKTQEKILPKLATIRLFAPSVLVRELAIKNTVERFSI